MSCIPVMDDPLGRYWDQPADVRLLEMDDTHVLLTPRLMARFHSYDCTLPSGVYPGKVWLRREPGRTLLVWYGDETPDKRCPILFREVLEVADAEA